MSRKKNRTARVSADVEDETLSISSVIDTIPPLSTNEVTLVEIPEGDGTYLVFGDPNRMPGQYREFSLFPCSANETLTRQVERSLPSALGGINAGVQFAHGLQQASGVIRLAPETLAALRAGAQTVVKDGWNLGTLQTAGKFAHQVRWLPAATASGTAIAIASSLGPALVLLAIQWQLGRIESNTREILETVQTVLLEQRTRDWAEANGVRKAILSTLGRAREVGAVTPNMWHEISGLNSKLISQRDIFLSRFKRHRDALRAYVDTRSRHEWLGKNSNAASLLADTVSLIGCEQGLFVYDCLKICHLLDTAAQDPRNLRDANHVSKAATGAYRERMKEIEPVIADMQRQLGLMAECHGKRWVITDRAKVSAQEMQEHASNIHNLVSDVIQSFTSPSALKLPVPRIDLRGDEDVISRATRSFAPDTVPLGIKRRLQWIIDGEERVKLTVAGYVSIAGSIRKKEGFLVLTDRRTFFLDLQRFQRDGTPLLEEKIEDVFLEEIDSHPLLKWLSITLSIGRKKYVFHGKIGSPESIGKALSCLIRDE